MTAPVHERTTTGALFDDYVLIGIVGILMGFVFQVVRDKDNTFGVNGRKWGWSLFTVNDNGAHRVTGNVINDAGVYGALSVVADDDASQ